MNKLYAIKYCQPTRWNQSMGIRTGRGWEAWYNIYTGEYSDSTTNVNWSEDLNEIYRLLTGLNMYSGNWYYFVAEFPEK